MSDDLRGLKVLVTRPAERSRVLADAVVAAGGEAVVLPMMRIEPLSATRDVDICARTRERMQELDRYRRVIFVSVNAVRYGMEWIHRYWPDLPAGTAWYAIGRATAGALEAAGVMAAGGDGAMDSESLLALPDFAHPADERILIVRGVGGREHLAQALRERGASVDYAECYRRRPPAAGSEELAAVLADGVDCIVVNSGETLQHLAKLLPGEWRERAGHCPLVVPGERVAQQARAEGFDRIVVAANAGIEATVAALHSVADDRRGSAQDGG